MHTQNGYILIVLSYTTVKLIFKNKSHSLESYSLQDPSECQIKSKLFTLSCKTLGGLSLSASMTHLVTCLLFMFLLPGMLFSQV